MNENSLPRRSFLKSSAALAAGAAVVASTPRILSAAENKRVIGANSRIRIAQVGCGSRGRTAHMEGIHKHVKETNFEIVAVVDPYKKNRETAAAMAARGPRAKVAEFAGVGHAPTLVAPEQRQAVREFLLGS